MKIADVLTGRVAALKAVPVGPEIAKQALMEAANVGLATAARTGRRVDLRVEATATGAQLRASGPGAQTALAAARAYLRDAAAADKARQRALDAWEGR